MDHRETPRGYTDGEIVIAFGKYVTQIVREMGIDYCRRYTHRNTNDATIKYWYCNPSKAKLAKLRKRFAVGTGVTVEVRTNRSTGGYGPHGVSSLFITWQLPRRVEV